jgi:branched-chain amino acid transport system permease protein/neutral amino acid transport system permease protein
MHGIEQYLISGIVTASILSLPAGGVTLIYGVLGYPNFAIAEYMTVGAYLTLLLASLLPLPFVIVALISMTATGLIAMGIDQSIFRRVREGGILPPILLSVGLMIFLQNLVRFFWGNNFRQFDLPLLRPYRLLGFTITAFQLVSIVVAVVFLILVHLLLTKTRFGRSVRATANNPELALVTGVKPERVAVGVLFLAGSLAGLGGVLLGMESTISPVMGWYVLLPVFAISILGGLGSILGTALAALLIGLVQEVSLLWVPPSYKVAVAFVVLAGILLVRPTGILGSRS